MGFAMIGAWQQTHGFQFVPATYWPVVRLEVQPPGIAQSFQGNQRDFALLCSFRARGAHDAMSQIKTGLLLPARGSTGLHWDVIRALCRSVRLSDAWCCATGGRCDPSVHGPWQTRRSRRPSVRTFAGTVRGTKRPLTVP